MKKPTVQDSETTVPATPSSVPHKPEASSWPHSLRTNNRQHTIREGNSSLRWILLVPVVIAISIMAALYKHERMAAIKGAAKENSKENQKEVTSNNESIKRKIRNNIRAYIKAESNTYQYGKFGGISNLKITVSNTTDYTLDKVRVKLTYIKASGGIWETRYEDFYSVKANTTITHKISDTKRGTRVDYEIADVKSKALGLD
jgi:hypothetical protein